MIKVSGPTSVAIYRIGEKKLFLFGCRHTDIKGLCPKCSTTKNCMFITDFITSIKNSDVFIESAWVEEGSKEYLTKDSPSSVLHTLRNYYYDNMYKHQEEPSMRFHYADIRFENRLWPLTKVIFDFINVSDDIDVKLIYYFKDAKLLKQFASIVMKSDSYEQSIREKFGGEVADKLLSTFFVPSTSDKIGSKVHRIRKQLLKLPKTTQRQLLRYHKDMLSQIISEYDLTDKQVPSIIFDGILPMLTHLMDMYLLSRMLFYLNNKETMNAITYTGAMHTEHYSIFFNKYMPKVELLYYENNSDSKRAKRCVTLPKSIVYSSRNKS